VTGGAGFIGRHLVDKLITDYSEVIIIDSGHTGQLASVAKEARLINIDLDSCEISDFMEILHGVDHVFHLAAQKHNTVDISPQKMISTNVSSTYNLIIASAKSKVKRFVFTSSLYAYGDLGPRIMNEGNLPQP
jgi:UDP-glucose 4-epimerase